VTRVDRYIAEVPAVPGLFLAESRTRLRRSRSRAHQLATLARVRQPVVRLAAIVAKLEKDIPRRRGFTLDVLLAYMVLVADWRSGRRSRPGRACSAEILGITEDAVRKLWRRMEKAGVLEKTAEGRHLPHAEVKLQDPEAYHVADRAEWTVKVPQGVWAEDITAAHLDRAVEAFRRLAARLAALDADLAPLQQALTAMTEAWQALAATRSDQANSTKCCPIYGFITVVVRSRIDSEQLSTPYGRKLLKSKADGATRRPISATKSQDRPRRKVRGRRMDPDAVVLARALKAEPRLPQLRNARMDYLTATVASRAKSGWTAWDVAHAVTIACQRRVERWGHYKPPYDPMRPEAWLKGLLADVEDRYPVETPPHVQAEAASAAAHAEAAQAAAERTAYEARRAARAEAGRGRIIIPATRTRSYRPVLAVEDAFADSVAARERGRRPAAWTEPEPAAPPAPQLPACQMCGNTGHDVDYRFLAGRGTVQCCEGCHAWHSSNPALLGLDLGPGW
jgi:hypothetical protein